MNEPHSSDKLNNIASDVAELKRWTERHEERHGDDADMLQRVLGHLDQHNTNHHGRASELKRTASIGAVLAILATAAETIRLFFL